jgi:hypothetical protein
MQPKIIHSLFFFSNAIKITSNCNMFRPYKIDSGNSSPVETAANDDMQ